ncbi:MAG: signal peptide peptidase SppA [Flavobacterium sp.]
MKFLGNVLATLVGIFIFCMLFVFGIVFISVLASGGGEKVSVANNSVIVLDLSEVTNDYAGKSKYIDFDYYEVNNDGLSDIVAAIENAKTDKSIKGISILNSGSKLGAAQTNWLRAALADFKTSKKFVYAYGDEMSQGEYYLNSIADSIYINPVGALEFKGLSAELMFFKDLQEKSGIKMEVIRHGKYKSAVEPFLQNEMSDANREQVTTMLQTSWNVILDEVSKSRKISKENLNAIADDLKARTPEMAKSEHLVDVVAYEDIYHNQIKKVLKVDSKKDYETISILDYAKNVATKPKSLPDSRIAIIYAQGQIMSGEGDVSYIGEGSMRRSIKEAREDDKVKAIVLRVDSPGGSALTSDLIWREIELTKGIKPVVVSMGNVAASGGYYISCNADMIFAEPNTITGSIGVFGVLPNFTELSKRIGIHTQQIKTNKNAAEYSPFVPLDDTMRAQTQSDVERIYSIFVNRVAEGRNMTFEQVDNIGQGRVWTGSDALGIGLVDKLGNLNDAVAEAAKMAKVEKYSTRSYPEYERNFKDLFASLMPSFISSKALLEKEIGTENYALLQEIKNITNQKGVQLLMPFQLLIK